MRRSKLLSDEADRFMTTWYVARTHVNAESKAVSNLIRQNFETYLPTCSCWRSHARRREVVRRPLFPGYVFVGFDIEITRWRSIFSTVGVVKLICANERPVKVPVGVVESIQKAEREGVFNYTHAVMQLKPGASVRIASGPFANLIGKLQSRISKDRVRVLVGILGGHAPTELALSDVEAI